MDTKQRRASRKPDGKHRDIVVTFRLAPDVKQALDDAAATAGTSRSDYLVDIIEEALHTP